MSLQDIRNSIICHELPKLVDLLVGHSIGTENVLLCEQFAMSKVRHHNYLSVNSHEIRRRINGLQERMSISNYQIYAERLDVLCSALISDPMCEKHYETDVQWSVLCFLLEVAQRPETGLAKLSNTKVTPIAAQSTLEAAVTTPQDLSAESPTLQIEKEPDSEVDSELSDWSCSDDDDQVHRESDMDHSETMINSKIILSSLGLKPPTKPNYSVPFEANLSQKWLDQNIQQCWWKMKISARTEIAISTEYCLIKEIIWMFIKPANCKFFSINHSTLIINYTLDVTIGSVSQTELDHFLKPFVENMSIMLRLKTFCSSVNESNNVLPPHSFECYAKAIRQCLQPFTDFLLQKDQHFIDNKLTGKPKTAMVLFLEMQPFFHFLKHLYSIHKTCVLDYKEIPPHVCSAHLYAGLLSEANRSSNPSYANLATAIFLVTVKAYITVIDKWWTDGYLDDWRNEFVVKNKDEQDSSLDIFDKYEVRLFEKNPKRSFYIKNQTSSMIMNSALTQMLCRHSMQAGYVLNILYTLNKISELKCEYGDEENLYNKFMTMVFERLERFQTDEHVTKNECITITIKDSKYEEKLMDYRKRFLFDENSKLALAIEESLYKSDSMKDTVTTEGHLNSNAYALFQRLNSISSLLLPIEDTILSTLIQILETRIVVANKCVLKMYKDEYQVLYHLKNLRKVYLLEASDLMYSFYSFIFKKIESGEVWNNPYILSDQLNSILCSKYPDLSSMFSVNVNQNKYIQTNVLEAINHLTINYVGNSNLQDIITKDCLSRYNQVFQFLLKVKWGLWTLENLRFSKSRKNHQPYKTLTMCDYIFKRFELVRNWIFYSLQSLHSHLMTHVLQAMGEILDKRIENAKDLNDIVGVHKSYISTIHDHCFQGKKDYAIRLGIEQLLALVIVVRNEWRNMEHIDGSDDEVDNSSTSQIDGIENTYINWHSYITGMLTTNVYSKNRVHLAGLAAAFSSSCPY